MVRAVNEAETWEIVTKKKPKKKALKSLLSHLCLSSPFNLMTDKPWLTINFMTARVFFTGSWR